MKISEIVWPEDGMPLLMKPTYGDKLANHQKQRRATG